MAPTRERAAAAAEARSRGAPLRRPAEAAKSRRRDVRPDTGTKLTQLEMDLT